MFGNCLQILIRAGELVLEGLKPPEKRCAGL